jgi:multiple antibiotic resistance protein
MPQHIFTQFDANLTVFIQTFTVVFVLADALGNAPIVILLTQNMSQSERNRVADRAALVATLVMLLFAFLGQFVLDYLHISMGALRVAGGLLLLLVALDMLQGKLNEPIVEANRDIAITPLALPLLAGPATLTTIMLLMSDAPHERLSVAGGIIAAMFVTWVIVRQSTRINQWIGQEGAIIAAQLLGFLLAALAIEIGSQGIRELFQL